MIPVTTVCNFVRCVIIGNACEALTMTREILKWGKNLPLLGGNKKKRM
jgi:hypothetical protein